MISVERFDSLFKEWIQEFNGTSLPPGGGGNHPLQPVLVFGTEGAQKEKEDYDTFQHTVP